MASVELFLLYQIGACDVNIILLSLDECQFTVKYAKIKKNDLDLFPKGWLEACDGSALGNEGLVGWDGRGVLVINLFLSTEWLWLQ